MKSFKLLLSVIALAVIAAAPVLRAEKEAAAPAGASENKKGPHGGDRLKALTEKLGLTEDQVAKIKPVLKDEMEALKALKEDTSIEKDAKREKMMEIRKSHMDQILEVLTPEQKAKMKDQMKDKKEQRKGGPDAPKPTK